MVQRLVKIIYKNKILADENLKEQQGFRAELDSLLRIKHENLARLHGHYEDQSRYYVVTDYFKSGSLLDELTTNGIKTEFET